MTTSHHSHAALLQLIAEGMRSSGADRLNASQRDRIAGLLDRIAVDLLVPTTSDDDATMGGFAQEIDRRPSLHG